MKELFERTPVDQGDFEERARKILDRVYDILIKKNRDYGGASFDMGLAGAYVHCHDKESRLRSLISRFYLSEEAPNFEGIEDTFLDLIGYSVIGTIIFEETAKKTGMQKL